MKPTVKSGILWVLMLIILAACKKEDSSTFERTLNIGALLPLSGTGESPGQSSREALTFAMEDIQQYLDQIGSEYKVNLTVLDTKTDTALALKQMKSLRQQGIQLVIGPYSSAEVSAVKQYADQNQMLVVSASSVATSLAIAGDNIFRLVPSDNSQGAAMDAWLKSDTVGILVPVIRNDIWGRELFSATATAFTAHGGIVGEPIYYPPDNQDFASYIQAVYQQVQLMHSSYPDLRIGVYMVSFGEGTRILEAASAINFWPEYRWYGSSAFANSADLLANFSACGFALTRNLVCPVFGLDESASDKWMPLMTRLEQKLGRVPEVYALVAYDALWLAVLTYLNTGIPVQTERLKVAFTTLAGNYYGVTGRTTLNAAGDRAFAIYDFWSVRLFMNDFQWIKAGWFDNRTGRLEKS